MTDKSPNRHGRGVRNDARAEHVLAAIAEYERIHRVPPVIEELADLVGCSIPVVHKFIARLEEQGRITSLWVSGRRSPRSLRVTSPAASSGSHATPATGATTMTMRIPTPANIAAAAHDDATAMTAAALALADYQARPTELPIYSVPTFGEGTLEDRARALGKIESSGPAGGPMLLGPRRVAAAPPRSTPGEEE